MNENRYLVHHGIRGQRWGIRRFQDKSGRLTKAGVERYKNGTNTIPKKKEKTSDKSELISWLTMNAANTAAVTVLASVGYFNPTTLIIPTLTAVRFTQAGKGLVKNMLYDQELKDEEIDPITGFHKKNKELSQEQDCQRVNPSFNNFDMNTKSNCMLCTTAYDLRRRGYDVRAKTSLTGYEDRAINEWYPKAKLKNTIIPSNLKETDRAAYLEKELVNQGDGARGNLMICWRDSWGAGHSVAYEIQNNKVVLFDAQSGTKSDLNDIMPNIINDITYARLDNVDFDINKIKEAAK